MGIVFYTGKKKPCKRPFSRENNENTFEMEDAMTREIKTTSVNLLHCRLLQRKTNPLNQWWVNVFPRASWVTLFFYYNFIDIICLVWVATTMRYIIHIFACLLTKCVIIVLCMAIGSLVCIQCQNNYWLALCMPSNSSRLGKIYVRLPF